jgi:hypothetical protein
LDIACDSGVPVGGGMSINLPVVGVSTLSDRPNPVTGTVTSWNVAVANASGVDLSMTVYIICTPAPASSSSAATAPQAQGAHIVKRVVTKLPNAAKA